MCDFIYINHKKLFLVKKRTSKNALFFNKTDPFFQSFVFRELCWYYQNNYIK